MHITTLKFEINRLTIGLFLSEISMLYLLEHKTKPHQSNKSLSNHIKLINTDHVKLINTHKHAIIKRKLESQIIECLL